MRQSLQICSSLMLASCLLALVFSRALVEANAAKYLDQETKNLNLRQVAKLAVCDQKASPEKHVISRPSTIVKVVDFLEALSNGDELFSCFRFQKAKLTDLRRLVSESNENVCSEHKLKLIRDFHERYLSTLARDVEIRQANLEQPIEGPLKAFFMYYALEVSVICRRNLINNLEWEVNKKLTNEDYTLSNGNSLDRIMSSLGEHFSAMKNVNSYDDIIMLWDIVDGSLLAMDGSKALASSAPRTDSEAPEESIELDNGTNQLTGTKIKLFLKSREPSAMLSLQLKCNLKFKPFYKKLILPIIQLSDLGYSLIDESFDREMKELKNSELVSRWYVITQICETILPIKFIQDTNLTLGQAVLITKEEATKLELETRQPEVKGASEAAVEFEPTTNSMVGVDELFSVGAFEVPNMMQSIKTNMSARDRNIKRIISRFARSAIDFIKSKSGLFLLSRKVEKGDQTSYVHEDMGNIAKGALEELDDDSLLEMQGAVSRKTSSNHHSSIVRHKNRSRNIDFQVEKSSQAAVLSYRHTKSIGQIMNECVGFIRSIAPSRLTIFVFGTIICVVFIITILLVAGILVFG